MRERTIMVAGRIRRHLPRPSASSLWWVGLTVITALAAFLCLWRLDALPAGFNQDEMALGYDAWSLWTTHRDQWGAFLPVHFRTFGDYVPPVGNYLTAPFVGVLGLDQFATRLPFALLGIATVLLCALLGRALFGRTAGFLAAAMLSFDPWHLNYSRIAFPASTVPFLTVGALYCFLRGIHALDQQQKWRQAGWLAASGLSFGLLVMSYPIEKIDGPILALLCLVSAAHQFRRHGRLLILWAATALLTASPIIVDQVMRWHTIQTRFDGVSIFGAPAWGLLWLRNYVSYYDPSGLLFDGLRGGVAVHPRGVGDLLWIEGVLCPLALYVLARPRHRKVSGLRVSILLLGWFATYPLAASLTLPSPHEIRAINILPLPELLAGYGATIVWQRLCVVRAGCTRRVAAIVAGVGLLLTAVNIALFLTDFFPPTTSLGRQAVSLYPNMGLAPIARDAAQRLRPCDTLWMDELNQTQIYYVFSTQYPPARFQRDHKDYSVDGFIHMASFGQIMFGQPTTRALRALPHRRAGCADTRRGAVYWLRHANAGADPADAMGAEQINTSWRVLDTSRDSQGQPLWSLLEESRRRAFPTLHSVGRDQGTLGLVVH